MQAAIEARAVSYRTRAGEVTVRDISLTISEGELVAIIGGSGSGKSTLLRAMSGLRAPTSGAVLRHVPGAGPPAGSVPSRRLGYIPGGDTMHPVLPLARSLRYSAELRGVRCSAEAAERALGLAGLAAAAGVPVGALNPGERKRAAIAAELLAGPAQLFLDEPTTGLDPAQATEVVRLLRRLSRGGVTVLLTTSSPLDAARCDKVAVLAAGGHLAFFGTPAAARGYFGADSLEEIYERLAGLGDPAAAWSRRFFHFSRTRSGFSLAPTTPRASGPAFLVPYAAGPHSAGRPGPAFSGGTSFSDSPSFSGDPGFPDDPDSSGSSSSSGTPDFSDGTDFSGTPGFSNDTGFSGSPSFPGGTDFSGSSSFSGDPSFSGSLSFSGTAFPGTAFPGGLAAGDEAGAEYEANYETGAGEDDSAFVAALAAVRCPDGRAAGSGDGPLPPVRQLPVLVRRNAEVIARARRAQATLAGVPVAILLVFCVLLGAGALDGPAAVTLAWAVLGGLAAGLAYELSARGTESGVLRGEVSAGLSAAAFAVARVAVLLPLLAAADALILAVPAVAGRLQGGFGPAYLVAVVSSVIGLAVALAVAVAAARR